MSAATLRDFLHDQEWDTPFFKRLSHNDSGEARGHQGGIVVPKELRPFFPNLDETQISSASPTTDRTLRAEMYLGLKHIAMAQVRYQFQTWGGKRSAESRITDNLGPLRKTAGEGDLLLFQRRADALDRFRLILVKKASPEFALVSGWTKGENWGALFTEEQPVTQTEILKAAREMLTLAEQPFTVVKPEVSRVETRQLRIARSSVFPQGVRVEYERTCCISGILIATPTYLYEVEAAHVVPVNEGGTDDIRNGMALAQTLHWAFDRGLFGILPNRTIYLPSKVKAMKDNSYLMQFNGKAIHEAKTPSLRVHADALHWHFENRVKQWD
jgi:putative restriction endonuclease